MKFISTNMKERKMLIRIVVVMFFLVICYLVVCYFGGSSVLQSYFFSTGVALVRRALVILLGSTLGWVVTLFLYSLSGLISTEKMMNASGEGHSGNGNSSGWASPLRMISTSSPTEGPLGEDCDEEVTSSTSWNWIDCLKSSPSAEESQTPRTQATPQQAESGTVRPATDVVLSEAGPSSPPQQADPYGEDELIGGESLTSIRFRVETRMLGNTPNPTPADLLVAEYEANDRLELKRDIIHKMKTLDPSGDWLKRGARALDNPRTLTGEEHLSKLFEIKEDLYQFEKESRFFATLQNKIRDGLGGYKDRGSTS